MDLLKWQMDNKRCPICGKNVRGEHKGNWICPNCIIEGKPYTIKMPKKGKVN